MRRIGEAEAFRDVARAAWEICTSGENDSFQRGESYFEFGDDDRLSLIVDFSDPPHYMALWGGPKAFVEAVNIDTDEERSTALAATWADDGRWVEQAFDKAGIGAVSATKQNLIRLELVGGIRMWSNVTAAKLKCGFRPK